MASAPDVAPVATFSRPTVADEQGNELHGWASTSSPSAVPAIESSFSGTRLDETSASVLAL